MKTRHYFSLYPTLYQKIKDLYGYEDVDDDIDIGSEYLRAIIDLCPYLKKYRDLCRAYTEDLLLYSMMYRNVSIQEGCNTIFDKKFFVDRKEQIIGFKKNIFQSCNSSNKEIILKLYYEYGYSFVKLCYNILGKTLRTVHNTPNFNFIHDIEHLNNLINGKLDNVLSINDFTEQECLTIIEHKGDLSAFPPNDDYIKRRLYLPNRLLSEHGLLDSWFPAVKHIEKLEEEKEYKRQEEEAKKRREIEEKRQEQYRFNTRNRHWRDGNVSFCEADHVYIVDGTPLDSVTTFVKNCFPEFDSEFHAKRKAEAMGITKEAVLEIWDKKGRESREQGTAMHKKIESYYLGKEPSTDETFELFKIFADKIMLKPYRTEWAVYDWEQKIAGTIDFVDYQNGEYTIYDWKRSDKLIAKNGLPIKNSQYGEKALAPIENLDDSPYYHYALQLSLYKYILEKNYDITVSKLRLGIFHPSYNKPYVLEMPYLQNEIDALFGLRSEVIF